MHRIDNACLALVCAAAIGLAGCAGNAPVHAPGSRLVTVKVIGFNDFHGNLQSPGTFGQNTLVPSAQRPAVGGVDALAAHVARMKRQNPLNVVVGAGDFIGASPLVSALFFDEPAVETLNRVGVEFTAVGNHEFDKGASSLLRLQHGGCKLTDGQRDPNSCQGAKVGTPVPFEGAKFQWLSANVVSTASGLPLLPAYGVKDFDGMPIAFIGMTLHGTPGVVTPSGIAGLEFRDEAKTVNALVPQLRERGIEAIVVLVHQGGMQTGGPVDINGCDGNLAGTEIAQIVSQLDDAVDLVISGHTHAVYNCSADTVDVKVTNGQVTTTRRPTGLANATGRLIPVTSAGLYGRVLTDIDFTLDRASRDVTAVAVTNRLVDRSDPEIRAAIDADPTIANIVSAYQALVAPISRSVVGSITRSLPNAVDAAGNMPAGELIADSQLAATAAPESGRARIALMNPGGVRSPGFLHASSPAGEGDGNITYGEAFTVQPFGNSLVTLSLSALQLKHVLEQQFAGCRGQTTTRILIPAAGFSYRWDAARGCDERVSDVRLIDASGATVEQIVDAVGGLPNPAKTYRVTVNSYLASGGDGYTDFVDGTAAIGGPQDIDAFTAYLSGFKAPAFAAYDAAAPARLKPRIVRVH